MELHEVNVNLGKKVDVDELLSSQFDKVVVATGVVPR